MSTTNSIFSLTITNLHVHKTFHNNKIQTLNLNRGFLTSSTAKSLLSIKTSSKKCKSRDVSIRCNIDPSGFSPPGSWEAWTAGLLLAMTTIPFWKNKWAPLLQLRSKGEKAVQTVEDITESIEKLANQVEDMAEDMAEKLPAGKLKNAVDLIEKTADKIGKDAHLADQVIDKLQEVNQEMETFFTHVAEEANEMANEANEIAKEAKDVAKEASEIVKDLQEVSKEANEIVKEAQEVANEANENVKEVKKSVQVSN